MNTIKFPITFDKGRISVLEEFTRPYYSQVIALACQIEKGEFPLEITYGVRDATFVQFVDAELRSLAARFWPEIQLTVIKQTDPDNNGNTQLIIDFVHQR